MSQIQIRYLLSFLDILFITRLLEIWKQVTRTSNASTILYIPRRKTSVIVISLPYIYTMVSFQVTSFKHNLNTLSSFIYWVKRQSVNLVGILPPPPPRSIISEALIFHNFHESTHLWFWNRTHVISLVGETIVLYGCLIGDIILIWGNPKLPLFMTHTDITL